MEKTEIDHGLFKQIKVCLTNQELRKYLTHEQDLDRLLAELEGAARAVISEINAAGQVSPRVEDAAEILVQLERLRACLSRGDAPNAARLGFQLGIAAQRMNLRALEPYVVRRKTRWGKGQKLGGGVRNKRFQAIRPLYQPAVDALLRRGSFSYTEACRRVANDFAVSPSTVNAHTKNPKKMAKC